MAWLKLIGWWALRIFIGLNILLLLLAGIFIYDKNKIFQYSWMTRVHYTLNKLELNELATTFLSDKDFTQLVYWPPDKIWLEDQNGRRFGAKPEQAERYLAILHRFFPRYWAPGLIWKAKNGKILIYMSATKFRNKHIDYAMKYWPTGIEISLPCDRADLTDQTGNCDIRISDKWTMSYTWVPAYVWRQSRSP